MNELITKSEISFLKICKLVVSEQRFSESSSQSSRTSALAEILDDDFGLVKKTDEKKISSIIKQLIKELLTEISDNDRNLEETSESISNFLQLSERIDHAKTKNEEAS
ncbi:1012_t:CDS:2 [Cetraspora pellucida]|uniref:1012_t:CDS:1 n=1 Tax=Cetraspora pellucida TaxID=1433469 RepID=A0A9N9D885_9GLOM|nr:1012_t:CDS:2 [Cetraspora pellucida]